MWVLAVIVAVGAIGLYAKKSQTPPAPGALDQFAECIKEKKAVFYGAFWCSHCQDQKKLFGDSARFLPYVECSTPDGTGQRPECVAKKVTGYPTWEFAGGTRESGELTLAHLAEKTGCALPAAK